MDINSPKFNDNRHYDYTDYPDENRAEYQLILSMIDTGSSVIDLGCGNGSLLQMVRDRKKSPVCGVELSKTGVGVCKNKGLDVIEGKIDEVLPFADKSFDYAVCNVTIQMVSYPEVLLAEMKRIAQKLIISFPNFGFYKNRMDMLTKGRMPKPMLFGYSWYSTGHIHQLSIADFYELVDSVGGLQITQADFADPTQGLKRQLQRMAPNLFQLLPVFLLTTNTKE